MKSQTSHPRKIPHRTGKKSDKQTQQKKQFERRTVITKQPLNMTIVPGGTKFDNTWP